MQIFALTLKYRKKIFLAHPYFFDTFPSHHVEI